MSTPYFLRADEHSLPFEALICECIQGTLSKAPVTNLFSLSKDFQNDRVTTNQIEEQSNISILMPVKL